MKTLSRSSSSYRPGRMAVAGRWAILFVAHSCHSRLVIFGPRATARIIAIIAGDYKAKQPAHCLIIWGHSRSSGPASWTARSSSRGEEEEANCELNWGSASMADQLLFYRCFSSTNSRQRSSFFFHSRLCELIEFESVEKTVFDWGSSNWELQRRLVTISEKIESERTNKNLHISTDYAFQLQRSRVTLMQKEGSPVDEYNSGCSVVVELVFVTRFLN